MNFRILNLSLLCVLITASVALCNPYDKPSKWAEAGATSALKEGTVLGTGQIGNKTYVGWQKPCTTERVVHIVRSEVGLGVAHCDKRTDDLRAELVQAGVLKCSTPTDPPAADPKNPAAEADKTEDNSDAAPEAGKTEEKTSEPAQQSMLGGLPDAERFLSAIEKHWKGFVFFVGLTCLTLYLSPSLRRQKRRIPQPPTDL